MKITETFSMYVNENLDSRLERAREKVQYAILELQSAVDAKIDFATLARFASRKNYGNFKAYAYKSITRGDFVVKDIPLYQKVRDYYSHDVESYTQSILGRILRAGKINSFDKLLQKVKFLVDNNIKI